MSVAIKLSGLDGALAGESITDLRNAKRLVQRHGDDLRYVPHIGWLAYTGTHWGREESGEVMRPRRVAPG